MEIESHLVEGETAGCHAYADTVLTRLQTDLIGREQCIEPHGGGRRRRHEGDCVYGDLPGVGGAYVEKQHAPSRRLIRVLINDLPFMLHVQNH